MSTDITVSPTVQSLTVTSGTIVLPPTAADDLYVTVSGIASQRNYCFNDEVNVLTTGNASYANTISGGGNSSQPNKILGNMALRTIGGGYDNIIGADTLVGPSETIASAIFAGAHNRVVCNRDDGRTTNLTHGHIFAGTYNYIWNGEYSFIGGGTYNKIWETNATSNAANGSYCVVVGGAFNESSGYQSSVVGGSYNKAYAQAAFIGGGANNTVAQPLQGTTSKSAAVIGGGSSNAIYCSGQSVIAGGLSNRIGTDTATDYSSYSTIIGGFSNVIGDGFYSVYSAVLGGRQNLANNTYTIASGYGAKADLPTQHAHGGGMRSSIQGTRQAIRMVLSCTTSGTTPATMTANGTALTVPADRVWAFRALVAAARYDQGNEGAGYLVTGCVRRFTGNNATLIGTPTVTVLGEDQAGCDLTVTTSGTSLVFSATGTSGRDINWVADLEIAQAG